ncbi:MAG: radical SAM protein, partial [Blastochloris sp.]|nr:radical SAM protein [Blastochloris sp.]
GSKAARPIQPARRRSHVRWKGAGHPSRRPGDLRARRPAVARCPGRAAHRPLAVRRANLPAGQPLAQLEEVLAPVYFHHRYSLEACVKLVGGLHYDHGVRGEGETALDDLIRHIGARGLNDLHMIAGITFMSDDGEVIETSPRPMIADLSAQPWPDREAIDIPRYMHTWKTHHGQSSISVIQSRGCPYTCTWCSHSVYGSTHRRRTPNDAADELLWIKERYNPDLIWYADDVFAINHRWFYQYAEALKQRGVRIPFECISRADRLNEDIVRTLADMGCFRLWNGSESGSQKLLDAMQRKVDAADVRAKTKLLQQHGIETGMFIMLGYEGEDMADIAETTAHLKESNPDIFLTTVAYPIKGTPFYNEVEARVMSDKPWEARSDRDLTIAGRRSRRFYQFATRWMVSEVALSRAKARGGVSARRRLKLMMSAGIGRVGMMLTQRQRERPRGAVRLIHAQPI